MHKTKTLLILAALFGSLTGCDSQSPLTVTMQSATGTVSQAGQQTVKLKVAGMSCFTCPYQVKSALKGIEGVVAATVSLETHEAEVTFDDSVTNVAALTQATTNAGFPSKLIP